MAQTTCFTPVAAVRRIRQRGLSFIGLLVVLVVLGSVGFVVAQAMPTYFEFLSVQKAAQKAANEGATPEEVRMVFNKASTIDNITSINGNDLDVGKEGGKVVVSFKYNKEIALFGPAYLVLKYSGKSQ